MVTYKREFMSSGRAKYQFEGLAADAKPTGEYKGAQIANGSSFLEIDTQNVSFYDESSDSWK